MSNIGSEHIVGLAGSGAKDGVAMAHYELHAWCLLVLAWVFVPFYACPLVFTMPESDAWFETDWAAYRNGEIYNG